MKSGLYRGYWGQEKKAEGIYRITCFGDSFVYGDGVLPSESLPGQLETILNRSLWEANVEVLNEGVSGFSIYDSWFNYKQRLLRYHSDLSILILTHNDSELSDAKPGEYDQHISDCWDESKPHLTHFKQVLREIKSFTKENNLPFVIGFLYVLDDEIRKKGSETLTKLTQEIGLDFVDLSVDFQNHYDGLTNKRMVVSSADWIHPSSFAYQIAARRLGGQLVRKGYLKKTDIENCLPENALYQGILNSSQKMVDLGYRPEFVAARTHQLLSLKRFSKHRVAMKPENTLSEQEYLNLTDQVSKDASRHRNVLFYSGYSTYLSMQSSQVSEQLRLLQTKVIRLHKNAQIIRRNIESNLDQYWPYKSSSSQKPDLSSLTVITQELSRKRKLLQVATRSLDRELTDACQVHWIKNGQHEAALSSRLIDSGCANELEIIFSSLKEIADIINQTAAAPHLSSLANGNLRDAAAELAGSCLQTEELFRRINFPNTQNRQVEAGARPFTKVAFSVQTEIKEDTRVHVRLKSYVPKYCDVEEIHHLVEGDDYQKYTFDFPLFTLGSLAILFLKSDDDSSILNKVKFSDITISNSPESTIVLSKDQLQPAGRGISSPILLLKP